MSKSDTVSKRKQSQTEEAAGNAVVWKNGDPFFELSATEIVYPLVFTEPGKKKPFRALFLMSTHKHAAAQEVAQKTAAPSRIEGGVHESGRPDREPVYKFIDRHFLRFFGMEEKDSEKHREWLNDRPYLKLRVHGEAMEPQVLLLDDAEPDDDFLFDSEDREIDLQLRLHCPDRKEDVDLLLPFKLRKETHAEFSDYEQAVGGRYNSRTKEFQPKIKHALLRAIFCSCVLEAPGYLWKGEPCIENNKGVFTAGQGRREDGWALRIPFHHWMLVVDEMMAGTRAKN